MRFFIDTANLEEIRELCSTGLVDGVTTNPSLVAKSGQKFHKLIEDICKITDGPVSAEVNAMKASEMLTEARELKSIAHNVVIKLPLTMDGLRACKILSSEGIDVNITLCFSAAQSILAAKAGAAYVSPFIGRIDDVSGSGMLLIQEICLIYKNYPEFTTKVLAASIRSPMHVVEAAKLGAHFATIPPKIIKDMVRHPLTDKGLEQFVQDWDRYQASEII